MIFAGIDVNIISHEKVLAAGVAAFGLWTWGMCYAQLHETNGRLPRVVVLKSLGLDPRTSTKLAGRLVKVSLWIENDDGSFSIANYEKKNQTAEEIRKRKAQSAERVRRWREAKRNANVTPCNADPKRVRTDPEPEPEPDNRKQKRDCTPAVPAVVPPPVPAPESAVKAKRGTRLPDDWKPTDVTLEWARGRIGDPTEVLAKFCDHWRSASGERARKIDWDLAFRFWVRNERAPAKPYANGVVRHVQSAEGRAWIVPEEMP